MLTGERLRYRRIAKAYDGILTLTGFKRGIERFLDRLEFNFPPRARLLDAGCGTGLISRYLARRFPLAEIVATDIDPAMLAAMRRQLEREGIANSVILAAGDLQDPHHLRRYGTNELIVVPRD